MAATNDQLLWLFQSPTFKKRIEGFACEWAHGMLSNGTANQKQFAAQILANSVGLMTTYAQRFTFSDNVMAANVVPNYAAQCIESTINDADLQSQVNTILATLAG